jgi:hypothetical protein
MPADEYRDVSVSLVEKGNNEKKQRKVRNTSRKQSKRNTSDSVDVVAVIKTEAFRIEPTKGIKTQQVFKLVPKDNKIATVVSVKSVNPIFSTSRKTTLIVPKVNILPKKKTMKLKIIEKKLSFPKITLPANKLKISLEKIKTKKRDYKERKLRIEL